VIDFPMRKQFDAALEARNMDWIELSRDDEDED
jgi:hypothetical protein